MNCLEPCVLSNNFSLMFYNVIYQNNTIMNEETRKHYIRYHLFMLAKIFDMLLNNEHCIYIMTQCLNNGIKGSANVIHYSIIKIFNYLCITHFRYGSN